MAAGPAAQGGGGQPWARPSRPPRYRCQMQSCSSSRKGAGSAGTGLPLSVTRWVAACAWGTRAAQAGQGGRVLEVAGRGAGQEVWAPAERGGPLRRIEPCPQQAGDRPVQLNPGAGTASQRQPDQQPQLFDGLLRSGLAGHRQSGAVQVAQGRRDRVGGGKPAGRAGRQPPGAAWPAGCARRRRWPPGRRGPGSRRRVPAGVDRPAVGGGRQRRPGPQRGRRRPDRRPAAGRRGRRRPGRRRWGQAGRLGTGTGETADHATWPTVERTLSGMSGRLSRSRS
jgi:hypothetical protein